MMQRSPTLQGLARRLLDQEAGGTNDAGVVIAHSALERMRLHLTPLVGVVGYNTLLSRALALASRDVEWLEPIRVAADGSLQGMQAAGQGLDPAEAARGGAAILSLLLELLVTFIGEDLTLRLIHDAWSNSNARADDASTGVEDMTQ